MSKKRPDDMMSHLANIKRPTDEQPTDGTPTTDKQHTNDTPSAHLERYHIRLSAEDYRWVKQAFDRDGFSFSAGVRMLIRRYLDGR